MGMLINGRWLDNWYDTKSTGGRFVRQEASWRNWITADGSVGPSGIKGFRAEPDRYHLYISYACPWAHRTLIFRELKKLDKYISISVVNWLMLENGWTFEAGPGVISDPIHHARYLYELYVRADPEYSGRVTVPLLWDRELHTIVNNESADIIRMLNNAFDVIGAAPGDYYPSELRQEIDLVNDRVYLTLNNGVYKCGFATTQTAYDEALIPLFNTLDWLEDRLSHNRYLVGERITEADWRLFTTLVRFDAVYVDHFKCNIRRLVDYPALWAYARELYQYQGIEKTIHFDHIKGHYYESHRSLNPSGVVPHGPSLNWHLPHDRDS